MKPELRLHCSSPRGFEARNPLLFHGDHRKSLSYLIAGALQANLDTEAESRAVGNDLLYLFEGLGIDTPPACIAIQHEPSSSAIYIAFDSPRMCKTGQQRCFSTRSTSKQIGYCATVGTLPNPVHLEAPFVILDLVTTASTLAVLIH